MAGRAIDRQPLSDRGKWGYEPLLALADSGFHLARVRQLTEAKWMLRRQS